RTRLKTAVPPEAPEDPQPADARAERADQRQILVDRKLRQDVVILRLAPPANFLLFQPVPQRADRPGHQAVLVAKHGREEEREDREEQRRNRQPAPPVPRYADRN